MYASFLAHKTNELNLLFVILVSVAAAILGDNIGFLAGRHFGPALLKWLNRKFHMDEDIAPATDLVRRHGPATVFWARYIFGLHTIAGPVAGALNMEWKQFLLSMLSGRFRGSPACF
jgi:membrane protein DedA with SNARE-associated domain